MLLAVIFNDQEKNFNMPSFKENLGFHANALHLRSRRNDMLASNIANAATPNFKARDLDFDSELKRINKIGNVASTDNRHFSSIQKRIGQDSVFRLPVHPSLDGNTVEMAVEQMQFSENVMRYQTTLTFLNNKISGLKSAIRGE